MTNKEFFRELKSKGVKIINSSKNNAATWMFLEKESFDPEAIFSQKTISRSNYFLLDKKWLVTALEKFKKKDGSRCDNGRKRRHTVKFSKSL